MWTLTSARNRLGALVDAALVGTPQEVTRRGKPAVVVLSTGEYRSLLARARAGRGSFVDHLLSFPGPIERAKVTARPLSTGAGPKSRP